MPIAEASEVETKTGTFTSPPPISAQQKQRQARPCRS